MTRITTLLLLSAGLSLAILGCGRNKQTSHAAELEKAFEPKTPMANATNPDAAGDAGTSRDQIQQTVRHAVSALKTNGYLDAFVALRAVQGAPNLTLDQYTAVVNARMAVEREVAARAVAGDPAALRAVEAIKGAARR